MVNLASLRLSVEMLLIDQVHQLLFDVSWVCTLHCNLDIYEEEYK